MFLGTAAEVRHAIMLTDVRNEHETPQQLAIALRTCERQFVCDTRGVGDSWSGTELRLVASRLLGTADGLARPADLAADFRLMTAMGKALGEVSLRLWTPTGSAVRFVRLAYPHVDDLSGQRAEVSARIGAYPTGAWGTESRDYHIRVDLPPGAPGEEQPPASAGPCRPATATLLERLVDVVDARTGAVRLREDVDAEMANVRSVRTVQSARG